MKRFFMISVALIVLGLSLIGGLVYSQEDQDTLATVQAQDEVVIKPSAMIKVGAAELRTPETMQMAEAAMGPMAVVNVPFMPTMSPSEYRAAKAAAGSLAAAAATQGAKGGAPLAPEALAPPLTRGVNYNGASQSGGYPPDTHGAAGPSNYVQIVNFRVVVYNKANPGAVLKSTALNAFFGSTEFVFDPRVVYDQTWNRWVVVATRRSASATDTVRRFFLAVSTTSDPAGAYYIYAVNFGGGPFNDGDWFDYPQLGMDQDAVIVTANVFDIPSGGFKFAAMAPIAKARIYNGLGFSIPVFTGLAATLAPPIVLDQNANAYLVAANNNTQLHLYRGSNLSNPGQATLVLQALVDVPDYAVPPDARQRGTTQKLDTSDRRFVNASTQYSDSLWNVHTIISGNLPTPKWYQIDTEGAGANTVKTQGFFFEGNVSDDWNASIAANTSGEVFVTWNSTDVANANVALRHQARVRISGKQPADAGIPPGSGIFTSAVALTGNPSNTAGVQRWGDYSAVSLDPSPSATCAANRRAWITNEKIDAASVWGSRIARIGFCN